MTYKKFKKAHKGSVFVAIAAEYIPGGFARKGDSLYGDCNDMIVTGWQYQSWNDLYTVYLKNPEDLKKGGAGR